MTKKKQTGSHLFFIEFLIVLFFFLIISTICLKLFVRADQITKEANALSQSQSYASSIAEAVEGSDGTIETLHTLFPEAECSQTDAKSGESGRLTLYFDRDFHTCDPNQAFYTLTAEVFVDNSWKNGSICVWKPDGTVFYQLPFSFCVPQTKKEVLP